MPVFKDYAKLANATQKTGTSHPKFIYTLVIQCYIKTKDR